MMTLRKECETAPAAPEKTQDKTSANIVHMQSFYPMDLVYMDFLSFEM